MKCNNMAFAPWGLGVYNWGCRGIHLGVWGIQELSELGFEIIKSLDSSNIIWNRIPQFRTFDTK